MSIYCIFINRQEKLSGLSRGTVSNSTDVHRETEQLGSNDVCASTGTFAPFAQSITNYHALGQVYNCCFQTAHGCGVRGIKSGILSTFSSVGDAGITILIQLPDFNPLFLGIYMKFHVTNTCLSFFKFSVNISLIIKNKN